MLTVAETPASTTARPPPVTGAEPSSLGRFLRNRGIGRFVFIGAIVVCAGCGTSAPVDWMFPDAAGTFSGAGDGGVVADGGLSGAPADAGMDAGSALPGLDAGTGDAGVPPNSDGGAPVDAGSVQTFGTCSCDATNGCSGCPDQTICNLEGECVLPEYGPATDGTVMDEETGLVWQQPPPQKPCPADQGECTWPDAQNYCQQLSLGGSNQWRLPTLAEVFSLIEMGSHPAIDEMAFPYLPGGNNPCFWTATTAGQGLNWFVNFGNGVTGANGPGAAYNVRCVH